MQLEYQTAYQEANYFGEHVKNQKIKVNPPLTGPAGPVIDRGRPSEGGYPPTYGEPVPSIKMEVEEIYEPEPQPIAPPRTGPTDKPLAVYQLGDLQGRLSEFSDLGVKTTVLTVNLQNAGAPLNLRMDVPRALQLRELLDRMLKDSVLGLVVEQK